MGKTLEIPIFRKGKMLSLIIEEEDWELVKQFTIHLKKHNHAVLYIPISLKDQFCGKRYIKLHRFLLNVYDDRVVDHIDGNPLNNTRANLRITTMVGNARNNRQRAGKSGFRGVYKTGRNKQWAAVCNRVYLGLFKTKEEAAHRWNQEAIKVYGAFAVLNKV
jgi:hypothetical protein